MKSIIYIQNPSRAHKILLLLEDFNVFQFNRMTDIFKAKAFSANADNVLILIDSFGRYAMRGIVLSIVFHLPLVLRLRGDYFREEKERRENVNIVGKVKSYLSVKFASITLWKCSKVICNSHYLANEMRRYLKRDAEVVYNPYTEPQSKSHDAIPLLPISGFHLLTITNMHLKSKIMPTFEVIQHMSVDVFNSLDIFWFICGKGHYLESLKELVEVKGLKECIIINDYVNDVQPLFVWADVLVHLTRMDAFPNCTMEAMMHGLPVITNPDSCGTVELVQDHVNGLVGDNILHLIETYKLDRSLLKMHADQGRKVVESKYSVAVQKERMTSVLMENICHSY